MAAGIIGVTHAPTEVRAATGNRYVATQLGTATFAPDVFVDVVDPAVEALPLSLPPLEAVRLRLAAPDPAQSRDVIFAAPPGRALGPGWYRGAVVGIDRPAETAGMSVLECHSTTFNEFHVSEIAWDGTTLTSLAVEYACGSGGPEFHGVVRYNSQAPFTFDRLTPALWFGGTTIGETSAVQQVEYVNTGTVDLHPGAAYAVGDDAADLVIGPDGCVGRTLEPGASCAVGVAFRPRDVARVDRSAAVALPTDGLTATRWTVISAAATLPTAITVTSSGSPNTLPNAAVFTARVTPTPPHGGIEWYVDGERAGYWGATYTTSRLGSYEVTARYHGTTGYLPSVSSPLTQVSRTSSTVTIEASRTPTQPERVLIRAQVTWAAGVQEGGTLSLWDAVSGENLGVISPGIMGSQLTRELDVEGVRRYRAVYSGVPPLVLGSEATAQYDFGDLTPPEIGPIRALPARGAILGRTTVPLRVSWSGSDRAGPVVFELQRSTKGGPWGAVAKGSAASVIVQVPRATTVAFRVRAIDAAGFASPWSETGPTRARVVEESWSGIRWSGAWTRRNISAASGGTVRSTVARGATARFGFTGRSFAVVAPTSSSRGVFELIVDGVDRGIVDLGAWAAQHRRVVTVVDCGTYASHRVTLRALGTARRPRVDIDAIIFMP